MTDKTPLSIQLSERFSVPTPAHAPAAALTWLSHETVMAVTGPDSTTFLQGQLTCDVALLPEPGSVLGARCNPKGRMQSSFRLLRRDAGEYLLAMAEGLLAPQIADLSKYAVFFKTQINDASEEWVRLGLYGASAEEALVQAELPVPQSPDAVLQNQTGSVVRLPGDAVFELWVPAENAIETIEKLLVTATSVPLNQWHLLQIRSGIGQVFVETRESFIPQMLNLQIFDGVSFKKGCYTGQEIVARMKYLGKLKKRMFRLACDGHQLVSPGTVIVNRQTGQALGEVVISALDSGRIEILAVIQKDAAQLEPLSINNSEGPLLTLAALPYETEVADTDVGPVKDKE